MAWASLTIVPLADAEHAPKEWWNPDQNGGIYHPNYYHNGHHYVLRNGQWVIVHDE